MANWKDRFMALAVFIGAWSKDRSLRTPGVGCVIVNNDNQILATGYNGFPRGIDDDVDARHERPEKYEWTIHAELNALLHASKLGIRLDGSMAYTNKTPCSVCMAALIQAGIKWVCCPRPDQAADKWADARIALEMADEAHITISWYDN